MPGKARLGQPWHKGTPESSPARLGRARSLDLPNSL